MRQHVEARTQETRVEAMRQAKQSLIRSRISLLLLLKFEARYAMLLEFEVVQVEALSH